MTDETAVAAASGEEGTLGLGGRVVTGLTSEVAGEGIVAFDLVFLCCLTALPDLALSLSSRSHR